MATKKQIGSDKKKFNLAEFTWFGFNYTVGVSFIGACAGLSNPSVGGIGLNILWIYIVEGLLAGICGWAFARLARAYKSSNNGGAYIYARGSFNKTIGLFVTFMLYVGMPFMITFQILMLIRGTFSNTMVWKSGDLPFYGVAWGVFGDFYLDLIGIGIYLLSALVIFFGMKWYKRVNHVSLIFKWLPALALIAFALFTAVQNNGQANLKEWYRYTWDTSNYNAGMSSATNANRIISSFNSCFYFFAGFEIFATAGNNVKDPEKNIGRGVTIIMLVSTIFYVVVLLIFFAAINPDEGFQQNETMAFWNNSDLSWIKIGGPIIIIISSVFLKMGAAMQNSLYSGTMIQPMAVEGYFPDRFAKLDKDGLPTRASKFNLIIISAFVIIWLLIPDLIRAFNCQETYSKICDGSYTWPVNPHPDDTTWSWWGGTGKIAAEKWLAKQPAAFDVASLTAASSTITLLVYIVALLSVIKMGNQRKITLRFWERIMFPITLVFMSFLFVYHYYDLIYSIATADTSDPTFVGSVVELVFVAVAISFFVIWYFVYYKRKVKTRIASVQAKLDAEFIPIDDWSFIAKELQNIIDTNPYTGKQKAIKKLEDYLCRNYHILGTKNNQHYREAYRLLCVVTNHNGDIVKYKDKISQQLTSIYKRWEESNKKHKIFNEVTFQHWANDTYLDIAIKHVVN